MAKLIKTDGAVTEITPKRGKRFSLKEVRELIGCELVEFAHIHDGSGSVLLVDEEGKIFGKPINYTASALYKWGIIAGDAILCKEWEVR